VRCEGVRASRAEVARMQFRLCVGGGGETTPLVCFLLFAIFCGLCWCHVSWVVCVHCSCLLLCSACCAQCVRARGGDRSSARACVRVWRLVHVHASVVDLASLFARGRPPGTRQRGRNRHPLCHARVCPPTPPSAAEWRRASQLQLFTVYCLLFSHHHAPSPSLTLLTQLKSR